MAVTLKELQTETSNRETLIERLRLERKALQAQIREKGFKVGIKSADHLSYQEFQRIERGYRILEEGHHGGALIHEDVLANLWTLLESHGYFSDAELDEGINHLLLLSDRNKAAFGEGWIEGVLSVWNEIKDQVDHEDLD